METLTAIFFPVVLKTVSNIHIFKVSQLEILLSWQHKWEHCVTFRVSIGAVSLHILCYHIFYNIFLYAWIYDAGLVHLPGHGYSMTNDLCRIPSWQLFFLKSTYCALFFLFLERETLIHKRHLISGVAHFPFRVTLLSEKKQLELRID